MSKHSRYHWIAGLLALSGCWDSVAMPIRIASDGGGGALGMDDGGNSDRDAAVDERGVPDTLHCAPVADWPEEWVEAERALFEAINALRATRPRCGSRGFEDLEPLRFAPGLRCSARLHSRDMDIRDFFDETNPDGETPKERIAEAGYRYRWAEESIVSGGNDHALVLVNLRENWDDCLNLFNPDYSAVGIGLHKGRWTLDFAGP